MLSANKFASPLLLPTERPIRVAFTPYGVDYAFRRTLHLRQLLTMAVSGCIVLYALFIAIF